MIWFILSIGFVLRLLSLNQSLWLDEAINVLATENYSFFGMLTEYAKGDFHPPLYFAVLWLWTKIFGVGEVAVRIPSVIFGLLTIYLVYLLGKKLHSKGLGLLGAFLLTINPLHIYYSQEARMYSLAALAVALNIFLFIKLLKEEKVSTLLLVTGNILVLMSDYVASLIFPAEFAVLFLMGKITTVGLKIKLVKRWFISLFIAGILSIWWLPVFFNQLDVGAVASANLPAWKFIVGSFDFKGVPLTLVKFIIGRIRLENKFLYFIILSPVIAILIFLIYVGFRKIKEFNAKLLISWLAVPIILASLISMFIPIYNYFRLLYTLPAFLLLISFGILSFRTFLRYTFLAIVSLILLTSSIIYLSNPRFQREDWRGVVSYLENQEEDAKVLFESSGTMPPFDYYNRGVLDAKGALKDFPVKVESGLADLTGFIDQSGNVYLINYLVDITDERRLVAKKIVGLNFKLKDTKDFIGVGFVYHYVKNE